MAYAGVTSPLRIDGVADGKIANSERVIVRVTEFVDLGGYGVCLGWQAEDDRVYPFNDNVFWFPQTPVAPPSYIFLYTGVGQTARTTVAGTGEDALVFHWGRPTTIFNVPQVLPILIKREVLGIGQHL